MADSPKNEEKTEIRKSICCICDPLTQCGLDVYLSKEGMTKVEGTKENPHNNGRLCIKGRATKEYVYHPDRLKTPLLRVGPKGSGEFQPISWDNALEMIAGKLQAAKEQYGPESVVFYAGYSKWARPFLQRLAYQWGSPNYASESSTCARATTMAWALTFGAQAAPDVENSRCLIAWSTNPFHSNQCLAQKVVRAKQEGKKIICVDPRVTPLARMADIHLQLKPGTDGVLALSLAHVMIRENLYDSQFISQYAYQFEEYKKLVQSFPPEVGSQLTGVPISQIEAAARLYAQTKPAALLTSNSAVVHHSNGVQNYRAVLLLIALTGNYDIKGGNRVQPQSYIGVSAGFKTRQQEYSCARACQKMKPRVGQARFPVWNDLVNEAQAMALPEQILSGKPYPLKVLLGFGINYRMWPDSDFMAHCLEKLDFVINTDLFMTDTCRYCDLILPACSSLERSEFRGYEEGYAILTQPAIPSLYQSRSDCNIIFSLADRLGLNDPLLKDYPTAINWILEPSGISCSQLEHYPGGMEVVKQPIPEKKYQQNGFATPTGKVEFFSTILNKHGFSGLPIAPVPVEAKEYPFILNTSSRLPMFIHTRTFRVPSLRALRPRPMADLNFQDAVAHGIRQGDLFTITTPNQRIQVVANVVDTVLPGVVHMIHGESGADVNTLIDKNSLDPISGYPSFNFIPCKIGLSLENNKKVKNKF
ncbi:molybdopterin-containing oxidoreductase family protein [Desulfitobacterium sp. AusDCA]|uniref:molybdopterin-containing oxidoreductase family protein n=1 Tax=Desulfitobacterium sp. AusDCA TaxID=3240383 RepID=UPI003DA72E1B